MGFFYFAFLSLLIASGIFNSNAATISNSSEFSFTAAVPEKITTGEDFSVFISLDESQIPVTFNLTLNQGYSNFFANPNVLITLDPNQSSVTIFKFKYQSMSKGSKTKERVQTMEEDLLLRLDISAYAKEIDSKVIKRRKDIRVIKSKTDKPFLILQTDKDEYELGMDINYRVFLFKDKFHLLQRPVNLTTTLKSEIGNSENSYLWENQLTMEKGFIATGQAIKMKDAKYVYVSTNYSDEFHETFSYIEPYVYTGFGHNFYVESHFVNNNNVVPIYDPKINMTISLFSKSESGERLPVPGSCEVKLHPVNCVDYFGSGTRTKTIAKNLKIGLSGEKQIELDIFKKKSIKRLVTREIEDLMSVCLLTKCFGTSKIKEGNDMQTLKIRKNMNNIKYLSKVSRPGKQEGWNTIVLTIKGETIKRDDDEDSLNNNLHVSLELSPSTKEKLMPAQNLTFVEKVSSDGEVVAIEFQVQEGLSFDDADKLTARFGDAQQSFMLNSPSGPDSMKIAISLAVPDNKALRRGENVEFNIKSDYRPPGHFSLNAVLFFENEIIGVKKLEFRPRTIGPEVLNENFIMEIPLQFLESEVFIKIYGTCDDSIFEHDSYSGRKKCGFIGINSFDVSGPLNLELDDIVNGKDLSTEVRLNVSGKQMTNVQAILGTFERLHSENNELKDFTDFNIITSDGDLPYSWPSLPINRLFPQKKSTFGFINFPVENSSNNNETITLSRNTRIFDRTTQSGVYTLKAMVISGEGEVSYTNEITFTIPPPPLSLSFGFIPPAIVLGETMEMNIITRNTFDLPHTGNISLEWFGNNSNILNASKIRKQVELPGNSVTAVSFEVKPEQVGDLRLVLKSEEFKKIVATRSTNVIATQAIVH